MRFLDFARREASDAGMKPRVLMAIVLVTASAGWAQAQSLADVARAEAARRKAQDEPVKVYTNDDLRADFTKSTPEPASAAGTTPSPAVRPAGTAKPDDAAAPQGQAAGGAVRDQAYWATRMTDARTKLDRSKAFAQALQNRIDMLWTDFVNRGDPVQQRAIEQDRNKALAELDTLKKEIDENTKAIAQIEDEARRAGVPAGWLRQ